MKLKTILLLMVTLLSYGKGWSADDRHLVIPDITIPSGSVAYFQIDLEDIEQTLSIDAEIEIPDNFAVLPLADDSTSTQYTLNLARNAKMTYNSSYPYNGKESIPVKYHNDVRFLIMTSDVTPIKGGSGWLVKLPMTTTAQPGVYEARMHTIHISNTSFEENDLPDIIVKITVTEPEEIRYTDNQIFCSDIEINQGEDAELSLSYNSCSDVCEYSANVKLPSGITIADFSFSKTISTIDRFTNNYSFDESSSIISISGAYGGRRTDPAAPAGVQTIATAKLNTSLLAPGEYEIKVNNQMLSNDDDDYSPTEYVGKLIVNGASVQEKCATPTITIKDNQLFVHSDTEGATYHTSIVAYDHKDVDHGEDEPIELGGQYLIRSYASANGYADSEPATATIIWNKKDGISSGLDEYEIGTNRLVLLQSSSNNIIISGVDANEAISLYDLNGTLLYQGVTDYGTTLIPYTCIRGQVYIVKVSNSIIKYRF